MLEGHPVHTTGPEHQHTVPQCAGKAAKTTAHYCQIVKCMSNKRDLVTVSKKMHSTVWLCTQLSIRLWPMQMRKRLDTYANLVHGFSMPGLKTRHDNIDIVVIRYTVAWIVPSTFPSWLS